MNGKSVDFYGKRKIFYGISIAIILIGVVFNIIFGVRLDIQFSGGTMISYTYNGSIDEQSLKDLVQEATPDHHVTFSISQNLAGNNEMGNGYYLTIQFAGKETIKPELQSSITETLKEHYPDNNFADSEYSSVDPTMGTKFFVKCLVAVAIACLIMVIYVKIRFKKIGGWVAGMTGLVALFHDVIIVYLTFVVFRMPIDSNFIAVVLMILGYSLNDTIVIYDRFRENRAKMGPKASVIDVGNASITQCMKRTICTSVTTIIAIGSVYAVCMVFNISSIKSFALPMMLGIISGCYSSMCIASTLLVTIQNRKKNKSAKAAE